MQSANLPRVCSHPKHVQMTAMSFMCRLLHDPLLFLLLFYWYGTAIAHCSSLVLTSTALLLLRACPSLSLSHSRVVAGDVGGSGPCIEALSLADLEFLFYERQGCAAGHETQTRKPPNQKRKPPNPAVVPTSLCAAIFAGCCCGDLQGPEKKHHKSCITPAIQ